MAISPIALFREEARKKATGDDKYFRRMLMFFEIQVPAEHTSSFINVFLFPLVIPPESYSLDEPFSAEESPTQGGGLYVEENGIIRRTIKLSGTTGFRPRPFRGSSQLLGSIQPANKGYTRQLSPYVHDSLTGHGHFKYLQDVVFRSYGDLKRDPTTAEGTKMIFHIPKDDEHWWVIPKRFTLERSASKSVMYDYSIELLVVDKADGINADFSEEKSFFDNIKDALRMIKTGVDLAQGALNDLTAIAADIKGLVVGIATIIDTATRVIQAASNFVEGVTDLIESPLTVLNSVNELIDEAGLSYETREQSQEDTQRLPPHVREKFLQLQDGLERIGTHPEVFEVSSRRKARENAKRGDLFQQITPLQAEEALATPSPTTIEEINALGTALTAGDVTSASGELFTRRAIPNYKSAKEIDVSQGDSLSSLAARYLGDARLWQDIAIVNGLKPPFMDEQASLKLIGAKAEEPVLPHVLGIGDTILVPSYQKPPTERPILPVLGAKLEESLEIQLLGRDFALELVPQISQPGRPVYDIPVDVEGGSIDAKHVAGIENLKQGVRSRVITEKGTDVLYKRVGVQRIVGMNQAATDLEASRFRITEAINADARIASVRKVTFEGLDTQTQVEASVPLDALVVDVEASVMGFSEGANVRIMV